MRAGYALALVLGGGAALFGLVFEPPEKLIWNRSASAPEGLYWLGTAPVQKGAWVTVSAASPAARWAQAREYTGADWPLLKRVAGLPGDEICRSGRSVFINGQKVAEALLSDHRGRDLPSWEGCVTLAAGELFLLSPHPSSLDGRYFGPVRETDILGVAKPLLTAPATGKAAE